MALRALTEEEKRQVQPLLVDADNVDLDTYGVVTQRLADNEVTRIATVLHEKTLDRFRLNMVSDNNVPLKMNHPTAKGMISIGRSFAAKLVKHKRKTKIGQDYVELVGKFFAPNEGQVTIPFSSSWGEESVVTLNAKDFWDRYNAGLIPGGSVGFRTGYHYCSECGNSVYSPDCEHVPGKRYGSRIAAVIIGTDSSGKSDAELIEYSLADRGVVPMAGPVSDYLFSYNEDTDVERHYYESLRSKKEAAELGLPYIKKSRKGSDGMSDIQMSQEQYREYVEGSVKVKMLTDDLKNRDEQITQLSESVDTLQGEKTELQTQLSATQEKVEELTPVQEQLTVLRDAAKEAYVKAHEQISDEELDSKFANSDVAQLVKSIDENLKKFYADIKPEGDNKRPYTDERAQKRILAATRSA